MGTRATIKFIEGDETYYAYRGHDGHPGNVIGDIEKALGRAVGRWSDSGELGTFVTLFLSMGYDYTKQRLPTYEITEGFHGDESHRYFVEYKDNKWDYGEIEL